MKRFLLTAALALPHLLLFAQAPSGVSLDRDQLLVGETVTVVVNFEAATRWCGLRVDLGDGDVRDVKVEDFPVTLTKQYASAGRYVIRAAGRALPRGLLSVLPCTGRDRTAALDVASARRDESPLPRQANSQDYGFGESLPPRQRNVTDVEREKIKKKERERLKHAEKYKREREKRGQAEQREPAGRTGDAVRRPPAREVASAAVPVPTRPRAPPPAPAPAPAPAASKPRDGSLKVF